MASVSKDAKGWRIRFYDAHDDRHTLRPGKVNKTSAHAIARHVENIVSARVSQMPLPIETTKWLLKIGNRLHGKLSRMGLVKPRDSSTLEKFVSAHIDRGKTSAKRNASEGTKKRWAVAQGYLVSFFADKPLTAITEEDAEAFRDWLGQQVGRRGTVLKENTVRSIMASAKMFLNEAKRKKLVPRNPFEHEVSSTKENRSRDFYVTPSITRKILKACPDSQWKLMFALWRLAGLRKSEIFYLTWKNVDWATGRMVVQSPKTSHHEGKEERQVPIRDVRKYLKAAFADAESDSGPVITRY